MADLKQGTTVGGSTIWSQQNLSLIPSGNSLSFKGFKVYTEYDKPTATDLGFLPAAGGALTGPVTSSSTITSSDTVRGLQLQSDYRVGVLRTGSYPYFVTVKSDFNTQTTLPSADTTIGALFMREGYPADPWNGKIRTNISTVVLTTGGTVTYIDNRGNDGSVVNQIAMNTDTQTVQLNTNLRVIGSAVLGTTTVSSLNTTGLYAAGTITSASAIGLHLNAPSASLELGSLTGSTGSPSIDFHTSGQNIDYDLRLTANSTSLSLYTNGNSTLSNFNMESVASINLHTTAPSQIKMSRSCVVLRDYYNGNVTLSASKRTDSDTTGGDLFLGYTNASTNSYTGTVRLEAPLTWKGTKSLIDANGNIVGASLDTSYLPLSGGTVSGPISTTRVNGSIFFYNGSYDTFCLNYASDGTFGVYDLTKTAWSLYRDLPSSRWVVSESGGINVQNGTLNHLANQINGRYGNGILHDYGDGNVTLSASTNASGSTTGGILFLGYNGTGHYTSETRITTTLTVTANATVTGNLLASGGYIATRATASGNNTHVFFQNVDGNERALIWADSANVLNLRSGSNQGTFYGSFNATNNLAAAGVVYTGNTASYLNTDGNVYGPAWGGWLSNWVGVVANNAVSAYKTQGVAEIGSYMMCRYYGTSIGHGITVSGSTISPATGDGEYILNEFLPGTWISCGRSTTTNDSNRTTIFRRIS